MKLEVEQGTLLAAWPDLMDPNFMHSVVLMCRHTREGAFGLVVNRPTDMTVDQLLPEHPVLGKVEFPIHLGGPVDHGTMQFVHRVPDRIPGGMPLTGELHLGGDLGALGGYLLEEPDRAPASVRLFLGYSGWGAGQLDGELALGSWVPAPSDPDVVFGADPAGVWKRVVRSVGKGEVGLDDLPPDVSWN